MIITKFFIKEHEVNNKDSIIFFKQDLNLRKK